MKKLLYLVPLLLSFLVSPTWAFPDNGVLDTFTGADSGTSPLSASWTAAELYDNGNGGGCLRQDNAMAPSTTGGDWGCYWNTPSFNANQEAYFTIVDSGVTLFGIIYGRIANPGNSTTDAYAVRWADATSEIFIERYDNGARTQLGATISQAITTTDKVGIKVVGDQICAWFSDSGGAWTELGCRTDATYAAGGFIGISLNGSNTVGGVDDFGGGNVTVATFGPFHRRLQ